jgi:2,3-bisphosphoglycerate-dependent phosphoglycerate mutase
MTKKCWYRCFFFSAVFLMVSCDPEKNAEITTFILIRHSEKVADGSADPHLSPEGQARAQKLALMLKDTRLNAIYSTNFKRTKDTVKPLAEAQGLDVLRYEPLQAKAIEKILRQNLGGTVLMCGHSNTTPWTANFLLNEETFPDYAEDEYGIMLIVSVLNRGEVARFTRLNY